MGECKPFKNVLKKPLTLAKIILGGTVIAIGIYYFVCSNAENFFSLRYLQVIQQLLLSLMFLLNGFEELRKPEGKKLHGYAYFAVVAFVMIVLLASYLKYMRM